MRHFIRKCVLEKEIYKVNLEPFRDLQSLLSNATSNINQITKRINSTGVIYIYKEDINDMKKEIEHFSKELWQIHSLFLNRTTGGVPKEILFDNMSTVIDRLNNRR